MFDRTQNPRAVHVFLALAGVLTFARVATAEPPEPAAPPPVPTLTGAELSSLTDAQLAALCEDAGARAAFGSGLVGTMVSHYEALDAVFTAEERTCEDLRIAVEGLAPAAERLEQLVVAFKALRARIPADCLSTLAADTDRATAEIAARFPTLPDRVMGTLERCSAHPGFADAARKGVKIGVKRGSK